MEKGATAARGSNSSRPISRYEKGEQRTMSRRAREIGIETASEIFFEIPKMGFLHSTICQDHFLVPLLKRAALQRAARRAAIIIITIHCDLEGGEGGEGEKGREIPERYKVQQREKKGASREL